MAEINVQAVVSRPIQVTIGRTGSAGREIELASDGTNIRWRYAGEPVWNNLVSIASLKGDTGAAGTEIELGQSIDHIQWRYVGSPTWNDLIAISAITGPQGVKGDTGATGATGATGPAGSIPALSIVNKNTNYILSNSDDIVNATTSGIVLTLHDATTATSKPYTLRNGANNNISFLASDGQTVNGSTSGLIIPGQALVVVPDGSSWVII